MIKPDGVQRGLLTPILERFLAKGYTLRGLKFMNVSKSLAETHYADLSSKPFFAGAPRLRHSTSDPAAQPGGASPPLGRLPAGLVEYITSGPVVAIALEGKDVVVQVGSVAGVPQCGAPRRTGGRSGVRPKLRDAAVAGTACRPPEPIPSHLAGPQADWRHQPARFRAGYHPVRGVLGMR